VGGSDLVFCVCVTPCFSKLKAALLRLHFLSTPAARIFALRARAGHFIEMINKKTPLHRRGVSLFSAWQARRSGGAVFAKQKKR
jgi:hypothetical protein